MHDVIEHHGVKGQKWGVRKSIEKFIQSRRERRAKRKEISRQIRMARLRSKNRKKMWRNELNRVGEMSNSELQSKYNRIVLENNFRDAVNRMDPKSNSKKKILETSEKAIKTVLGVKVDENMSGIYRGVKNETVKEAVAAKILTAIVNHK